MQLFHDGGPYHIETSSSILSGFYIIWISVMKELMKLLVILTSQMCDEDSQDSKFLTSMM